MKVSAKIKKLVNSKSSRTHISRCRKRKKIRNYLNLVNVSVFTYKFMEYMGFTNENDHMKKITSSIIKDIMNGEITYKNFICRYLCINGDYLGYDHDEMHNVIYFKVDFYNKNGIKVYPIGYDEDYNIIYSDSYSNSSVETFNYNEDNSVLKWFRIFNFDGIPEIFLYKKLDNV